MSGPLIIDVTDLIGHPDAIRDFSGDPGVSLRLGDTLIDGPMQVEGQVRGTVDGVLADFTSTAKASLTCVRCLVEWEILVEAEGTQHFGKTPDEDGYAIEHGCVDITGPATDEMALAMPAAPICRDTCKGLCPICGTDLNSDPCDGHGEEADSPFAVLRDLFDS